MEFLDTREYLEQFEIRVMFGNGGKVRIHRLVNLQADDYKLNFRIAVEKARKGCIVDIMPTLVEKDSNRALIFPDSKALKNPDLRINGILYEVENPTKPNKLNNLNHRISAGANQADFIIVNLEQEIGINLMRRVSKGKFIDFKELQIIEFRFKETFVTFKRDDFIYDKKEPLHDEGRG